MPEIRPFRALRYSPSRVPWELVVSPPAPLIHAHARDILLRRHPMNAVRLLSPAGGESSASASALLDTWQRTGVLVRDDVPGFYGLAQSFRRGDGSIGRRLGLFAMCRLEDLSTGPIRSRQRTLPVYLEEAVKRYQHTNVALQPVLMALDAERERLEELLSRITDGTPDTDGQHEGVITRLWRIVDPALMKSLCELLLPHPLVILSGHHEYEAALTYRDLVRLKGGTADMPAAFVLVCITGLRDDGIALRPVYRMVQLKRPLDRDALLLRLSRHFTLQHVPTPLEWAHQVGNGMSAFGMAVDDRLFLLRRGEHSPLREILDGTLPPEVRALDITILHSYLLGKVLGLDDGMQQCPDHVAYEEDFRHALEAVQRREVDLVLAAGPPSFDDLRRLERSGSLLPPFSFACHPGIPAGLVMNRLDEGGPS